MNEGTNERIFIVHKESYLLVMCTFPFPRSSRYLPFGHALLWWLTV